MIQNAPKFVSTVLTVPKNVNVMKLFKKMCKMNLNISTISETFFL